MWDAASIVVSDATYTLLRDLIHERLGVFYSDEQQDLLVDKVMPRLYALGVGSLLDYYYLLRYDPQRGEEEWQQLQSLLAVNESYFWREYRQIEVTARRLVPALQARRAGTPVRIWHAACAAGEEPYTMVITLMEQGGYLRGPVDILASDMDAQALERARRGVYRERAFRAMPPAIRERYFDPLPDGRWQLHSSVRERVSFLQLNLMDVERARSLPPVDIIFARNVFIYFSPEATRKVVEEAFYDLLRAPGYLFVGAAESLLRVTSRFAFHEVDGAFVYTKVGEHPERGVA